MLLENKIRAISNSIYDNSGELSLSWEGQTIDHPDHKGII